MKIWVARIPDEGSHYEGDEPGEILELENDPFYSVEGDVHYVLEAQVVSEELVVRGVLSVEMNLKCNKMFLNFFSTNRDRFPIFLRAYPRL